MPVKTNGSGEALPNVSFGYPSMIVPPFCLTYCMAYSRSLRVIPVCLNFLATKKQTTDQTGLSSTFLSTRDFSNVGYSLLGATAHQPTGSVPKYAIIPGTFPESTIFFNAFRFCSPRFRRNSDLGSLHHMHQHPPHAPRGPNSCSRSFQHSFVKGRNATPSISLSFDVTLSLFFSWKGIFTTCLLIWVQ
jgi:hypothetical protein